ncbi:MAG: LysR family transcriptional regulator [Gammaproteobacteria bacterium]|nr:LysR family transcriptional regulator [Gammaproteobacteria bacterium]
MKTRYVGKYDYTFVRVFQSVVRHSGFSAAQQHLGLTQATISNHMTNLEARLGVVLCERGRRGFGLTSQGKLVHAAMLDLLGSIENFRGAVGAAKGELIGTLHFGTVDAMYTNSEFPISKAVAEFTIIAPAVSLDIDIASPQDLIQGLLNGRCHIILTPLGNLPKSMKTITMATKCQQLYCGENHALFTTADEAITPAMLKKYPFAGRSYMDAETICGVDFSWKAITAHMESTALLIASGRYIGFLPDHFAQRWTRRKQMRALRPDIMKFDDIFKVDYRHREQNLAASCFAGCIEKLLPQGA